ncbi:MAG: hypothetical protein RLZ75_653 [Pseudomonadota bacterium]
MFIFIKRYIKNPRIDLLFFIPIFALFAQAVIASLFNLRSPFWLDDVIAGAFACQPTYIDTLNMAAGDVHPPLFYLWVHTIFDLFGCNLNFVRISNAIVLIGSGGIYCFLLRQRFGVLAALTFATLFFGSSFVWHYAYEAKSYAFLVSTAVFLLYAVLNNKWNMGLVATAIGASLHYYGAYLFIVQVLMFFLLYGRITASQLIKMVIALVLVSLQYAYSLPLTATSIASSDSLYPLISWLAMLLLPAFLLGGLYQYVLVMPVFFALPKTVKFLNQFEKNLIAGCLLLPAIFVIAVFLISLHKLMFVPRHFLFLTPLVFTGISVLLPKIADNYSSSKYSPYQLMQILVIYITIYICFGVVTTLQKGNNYRLVMNWNDAAKTSICSQKTCGFVIADFSGGSFVDSITSNQYNAFANFLLRANGKKKISWVAIKPKYLENWIANNRDIPFVYVNNKVPINILNLDKLINTYSLSCTTVPTEPSVSVCQR